MIFDRQWIDDLGYASLDLRTRTDLVRLANAEFLRRVGDRITDALSDEDVAEFNRIFDDRAELAATAWLDDHHPGHADDALQERVILEDELRGGARVVCDVLVPGLAERRSAADLHIISKVDDDVRADVLCLLVEVFGIPDRERVIQAMDDAPGSALLGVPESAAYAVVHPLRHELGVETVAVPAILPELGGAAVLQSALVNIDVDEADVGETQGPEHGGCRLVRQAGTARSASGVVFAWELLTQAAWSEAPGAGADDVVDVGGIESAGISGRVLLHHAEGHDRTVTVLDAMSFSDDLVHELAIAPVHLRQLVFRPFPLVVSRFSFGGARVEPQDRV